MDIKTIDKIIQMIEVSNEFQYNQHSDIQGNTKSALLQCLMELKEYKTKKNND